MFVCGRAKDIIIVRGRNYHPNDIEWAVSQGLGPSDTRRGHVVAFGVHVGADGSATEHGTGEEQLVVCCEAHSSEAAAVREAAAAVVGERFGLGVHGDRGRPAGVPPAYLERKAQATRDPKGLPRR